MSKAWSVSQYGYEWFREADDRWLCTWPVAKPLGNRQKHEYRRPPDWVWATWCAYQVLTGGDI